MTLGCQDTFSSTIMRTYNNIYHKICSYENLFLAYEEARKHKTTKPYVRDFEKDLKSNLLKLVIELQSEIYKPEPLITFILRDPKTRKISKSEFKDRVVHHAICNIIEPILDKTFIYDSYANRRGKGTLNAIKRFLYFKRIISRNYTKQKDGRNIKGFVLKADVRKFFDSASHEILLNILSRRINDDKAINLIRVILENHEVQEKGKGMPLGNLTSQFFANVYLNELDHYVKEELRAKYYIRYVDDFVILHRSKEQLEEYKDKINIFLKEQLDVGLHPEKSRIKSLYTGTTFLGLRIYSRHRLLAKKNLRKFNKKTEELYEEYKKGNITYDDIYDYLEGWITYSKHANTFKLRKKILAPIQEKFAGEISTKEFNRHLKSR